MVIVNHSKSCKMNQGAFKSVGFPEAVPDIVLQAVEPEPVGSHFAHHIGLHVQRVWQSHHIWFPGR
jgi:hypothetical protein